MDPTYAALKRLYLAVRSLAATTEHRETKQKVTLFEASPTHDAACLRAWQELDAAQKDAARALALGPEGECEAGVLHPEAPRRMA